MRQDTSMPRTIASISCRPDRPSVLGQRQRRRGHRARRVDDGLQVGVVEVEGVRADAVEQRRAGHVDLLGAAEHARLRGGLQHLHGGQRGVRPPRDRRRRRRSPAQFMKVRWASWSTASLQPREGCVATKRARVWVMGGALWSAATWVLRAMGFNRP